VREGAAAVPLPDHRDRHPHTRTHADTTVPSKGQRRACALADRDATAATAAVAASGWRCAPLRLPLQPPAATVWLFSFRPPAPPLSHRDTFNRRCAWPIGRRCPIMTPRSTALPPPPPPPAPRCWPTAPFSPSPDRCACAQIHWQRHFDNNKSPQGCKPHRFGTLNNVTLFGGRLRFGWRVRLLQGQRQRHLAASSGGLRLPLSDSARVAGKLRRGGLLAHGCTRVPMRVQA